MKLCKSQTYSRAMILRISVSLAIFLCHGISGFQLSMVASRVPFGQYDNSAATRSPSQPQPQQQRQVKSSSQSVTSGLVSNLAVVALKRRLHGQTHVSCDVTASSSDLLLKGQVGPVTVKGRGWQSRLGLTCRAIEATVDSCQLDVGGIMANQKLVLTVPAEGNAMVALNAIDFGNFIKHPLMQPPGLPQIPEGFDDSTAELEFLREGVSIDSVTGEVVFFGTYLDMRWRFNLSRGSNGKQALIRASLDEDANDDLDNSGVAEALTTVVSKFFNEMVFELDGTLLSFRDMMVTGKGKEPSVMLSLSIQVHKFPSPGLEF